MTLAPGTKLGPYRIVESIGAGGMGEVYKSEDTRLGRRVAIKVLPAHLADNAELRERFEREARAISSLNHPHICTVHDVGRENGVDFIVMELLEGETLADRLTRRALSLDDALRYGVEIADALDQAHQNGVIHRDVKPGNIMLGPGGAKLLDFGLAKQSRNDKAADVDSATPTQQRDLTSDGAVLGTFRYMAPEQLEGGDVDARTDIFAFGVVLYEMVTGKKAFDGRSQASLTAAILDSEPDSIATSAALDWIVRTAMAKDPNDRWRSMHDVKLELERLADVGDPDVARASRTSPSLAWAVAALAIGALAVSLWTGDTSPPRATKRFTIPPPEGAAFSWQDSPEISPDGSLLALVAEDATGIRHLWIRPLDDFEARALPGTEGARQPFWAPDGRSIGFFAGGDLKKIEIDGTAPETLAQAPNPAGGAWSSDGTIVFTPELGGLVAVPHTGGDLRPVSVPDADQDELLHRFPVFLPDGRHFLFVVQAVGPENSGLFVGTVDSEEKQRVGSFPSRAIFAPPGYLLYRGESALMAQRFDLDRLELVGDPFAVDEAVAGARTFGGGAFSVSENGMVVFRPETTSLSRLVWFDREGNTLRSIGEQAEYNGLDLAAEGTRILVELLAPETRMGDLWLLDDSRGTATRLTHDSDWEFSVSWSRDGSAIFFATTRGTCRLSLTTGEKDCFEVSLQTADVSPDGSYMVGLNTRESDLWLVPMADGAQPRPYLETPFFETHPRISPDGKWLAYSSNESGRPEVYVQSFPELGGKVQISNAGGEQPIWRSDGRELFYVEGRRRFMVVSIEMGGVLEPGLPEVLFETPLIGGGNRYHYDVSADGERFIAIVPVEDAASTPIHVVVDWMSNHER